MEAKKSSTAGIPRTFLKRRLHSLLGLWLSIFLMEHLFTNSQAALYFRDSGSSFIKLVNRIHETPFLIVVEITFLALPFLLHAIWGIAYLVGARLNSFPTSGKTPSLPQYKRNRAYTWQRITALLLVPAIFLHVYHMRFHRYPMVSYENHQESYVVRLKQDQELSSVVSTLKGTLFSSAEKIPQTQEWKKIQSEKPLKPGEALAEVPSFGAATYLNVRETFKSPTLVLLYSIFVIAACFHGFNGLWTFLITWGVTLSRRAQLLSRVVTTTLMGIVMTLGLVAIWGTYWTFVFSG